MKKPVYLGVDGGATKTEVVLIDHQGNVIVTKRMPGVYVNARASKKVVSVIQEGIALACKDAGISLADIAFSGFGVAGVDYADELKQQRQSLYKPLGLASDRFVLVNDGIVALWGGTAKEKALVLQVGTGYTAAYRSRYGEEKSFDQYNCGIVFDLRKTIYAIAMRIADGREKPSILKDLVMQYFEIDHDETLIKMLHRHKFSREKVMNILIPFNKAVKKKDKVALRIVDRAAENYAHDIRTMIKKIGNEKVDVVLGGGVILNGPPVLIRKIRERVCSTHPKTTVHMPRLSPGVGAALMAATHAGEKTKVLYKQALKSL